MTARLPLCPFWSCPPGTVTVGCVVNVSQPELSLTCVLAQGGEPREVFVDASCRVAFIERWDRQVVTGQDDRKHGEQRALEVKYGGEGALARTAKEVDLGLLQGGPCGREADPAVDAQRPDRVLDSLKMHKIIAAEQRAPCGVAWVAAPWLR